MHDPLSKVSISSASLSRIRLFSVSLNFIIDGKGDLIVEFLRVMCAEDLCGLRSAFVV